jgi:hypothetical protein
VIDWLDSRVASFQLGKGFALVPGAVSPDRGAAIRIRNHCDHSCNLTAGKNFTRFVEITPHLCKVPEVNSRPLIHCTLGDLVFESATSKDPVRIGSARLFSKPPDSPQQVCESSAFPALCRRSLGTYEHRGSSLYTLGSTASYTRHRR